jgi:hypothetical protein
VGFETGRVSANDKRLYIQLKKFRTFAPKYRALEKNSPENANCALWKGSRYGSGKEIAAETAGLTPH